MDAVRMYKSHIERDCVYHSHSLCASYVVRMAGGEQRTHHFRTWHSPHKHTQYLTLLYLYALYYFTFSINTQKRKFFENNFFSEIFPITSQLSWFIHLQKWIFWKNGFFSPLICRWLKIYFVNFSLALLRNNFWYTTHF